jgi:hypothetical protein
MNMEWVKDLHVFVKENLCLQDDTKLSTTAGNVLKVVKLNTKKATVGISL